MIIDLHTHTHPFSDDSRVSPDELISKAKTAGLDGICLTEHEHFWEEGEIEKLRTKHDFLVLPGVELNAEIGHVLVFGLHQYLFGMHHLDFVRQKVDEAGGIIILAHPYRRRYREWESQSISAAVDKACREPEMRYIDAIEALHDNASEMRNEFSHELCRRLNLKGTGGSDAHSLDDIPSCATLFEREINSLDDLIQELKAGRFKAVDNRKPQLSIGLE
ncbi:MAG: PHP domain-containing protein [Chloroflexota bacterium]|nr:PHP domain-containing protein [Chloroflexota bacterium]